MNCIQSRIVVCCLLCVSFSFASSNCFGISVRDDRPIADYNNIAAAFPATGYFYSIGLDQQHCTGTLVSPTQILTAAHCIDDGANGTIDNGPVDLIFGLETNIPAMPGPSNVASIVVNPMWQTSGGAAQFDMAVVTLNAPIIGVTPATLSANDPTGLMGFMVGYGTQGDGANFPQDPYPGANSKLGAHNIIDFVGDDIQTDFDSPASDTNTHGSATALNLEGTTGSGDSGGPLYAQFGSQIHVVGALNGGINNLGSTNPSEYGDVSFYAPVGDPFNRSWLAGQGIFAVPEPGSAGLISVVLVGWLARRRKN